MALEIAAKSETAIANLSKQDAFWKSTIKKYHEAINCLQEEENTLQQRVDQIRILTTAIIAFYLSKVVNEEYAIKSVNQLIKLHCICPQNPNKELSLMPPLENVFDIEEDDISQMDKIQELGLREKCLIDEVNKFRGKNCAMNTLKKQLDSLMVDNFGPPTGMDGSEEIKKLQKLTIENRNLKDQLMYYEETNSKWLQNLTGPLQKELDRLKKSNKMLFVEIELLEKKLKLPKDDGEIEWLKNDLLNLQSVRNELILMTDKLKLEIEIYKGCNLAINNISDTE